MQVHLNNPSIEQFITEAVKAGHFASAEAAVEAAVEQMMQERDLDDETIAAINRGEDEIERGETIDFDTFAAEFRRRIASS